MSPAPLLAIVRGGHIANRSPRGGRSYAPVRGLIHYLTFGSYAQRLGREPAPRGVWLDHRGQAYSYEAVRYWAKTKVHHLRCDHAYQLLLSTRYGGLTPADFNRVLAAGREAGGMPDWRQIVHSDTAHQHAHALLFREEKLNRAAYKEWQQAMQIALGRLQEARQQELALEQSPNAQDPLERDQRQQALELTPEPAGSAPPRHALDLGAEL